MNARLTTGEVINLPKDCTCITHDGPHWLHMDALHKRMNDALLDSGRVRGYLDNEIRRLDAKATHMMHLRIVELLP